MEDILEVKVNSPDKVLWQGSAFSVSSENSEGQFDILPQHANFITMISQKPLIIQTLEDGQKETFIFTKAVLLAHKNTVRVYAHL